MWPDWVSNPGTLALETDGGEGTYTDQTGGGGYWGGRELGRGRLIEGCRNKVERCTV